MNEEKDFTGTNFEAIDKNGAEKIISDLPEFEPTIDIEETDYQLGDIMFNDGESHTIVQKEKKEIIPAKKGDSLQEDFDDSRQNLREMSARQAEIIDNLFKLCKASDSPRAYEVLGQMIDRFTVLEEKMLDLYLKKTKIEKESGTTSQIASTINNNQYNVQLSTRELLEQLKEEDQENDE